MTENYQPGLEFAGKDLVLKPLLLKGLLLDLLDLFDVTEALGILANYFSANHFTNIQ